MGEGAARFIANQGIGAPTYKSEAGTLYWDAQARIVYVNQDGGFLWATMGGSSGGSGISARITNSTFQAIGTLSYDTVDFNNGGVFNAGSPTKLTAPVNGIYTVSASARFISDGTGTLNGSGSFWKIQVIKNRTLVIGEDFWGYQNAATVTDVTVRVANQVQLVAGDFLETLATTNYQFIDRVAGNSIGAPPYDGTPVFTLVRL